MDLDVIERGRALSELEIDLREALEAEDPEIENEPQNIWNNVSVRHEDLEDLQEQARLCRQRVEALNRRMTRLRLIVLRAFEMIEGEWQLTEHELQTREDILEAGGDENVPPPN